MNIAHTFSRITSYPQQIQYYQGLGAVPWEKVNNSSTEASAQGSGFTSAYAADSNSDARLLLLFLQ